MFLCLIGDVMFLLVQTTPMRKGELMRKEQEITSMRKKKCLGPKTDKSKIFGIPIPKLI